MISGETGDRSTHAEPAPRLDWKGIYYLWTEDTEAVGETEILFCLDACLILFFSNDQRLLNTACRLSYTKLISRLLSDPCVDPRANHSFCFIHASTGGHAEVVRLLLADGRADPRCEINAAFRIACAMRHAEIVSLLLTDGRADPNSCNWHQDDMHSERAWLDVTRVLLSDPRFDPTLGRSWCLRSVCSRICSSVVALLLADGRADPTAYDNQAIREAYQNKNIRVLNVLALEPRIDIKTRARYNSVVYISSFVAMPHWHRDGHRAVIGLTAVLIERKMQSG